MITTCHFIFSASDPSSTPLLGKKIDLLYGSRESEVQKYIPNESSKQQMCLEVINCSQIRSISFIGTTGCLYMQRGPYTSIEGFVTSEETVAYRVDRIDDTDFISQTVCGMDATIIHSVRAILKIFLEDQNTRALSLTYLDGQGGLATRLWKKTSDVEFAR